MSSTAHDSEPAAPASALSYERAYRYSPLSFLHPQRPALAAALLRQMAVAVEEGALLRFGTEASLFVRHLDWDTRYFGCPVYRIDFSDWAADGMPPARAIARATQALAADLATRHDCFYLFGEVPAEDTPTLQGLGEAGLRLIETRLTYFRDDLQTFAWSSRFPVRPAREADISTLRTLAANARNAFDRFHADPFFTAEVADDFLATFAESSVRGYADIVLVPADGGPPDAFFTGKSLPAYRELVGVPVAQIVLVAVSPSRRGWHLKLFAEMANWFRERGVQILYMVTQATNRPVIRNCEKLGFRYGRCTHILATHR